MLTSSAIDDVRFSVTKFREGYEQAAVDDFLAEARLALAAWEAPAASAPALSGDDVVERRFAPTKFGNGYDQDEVDDFLDLVTAALRGHEAAVPLAPVPSLAKDGPVLTSSSILDKRFTVTRFRAGYSQAGVDGFLVAARAALADYERGAAEATPPLSAEDVVNVRFKPTAFRAGYDQDEVDTYLDEIVVAIRHYTG
jgi:DivIVA domain-containing protein